MPGETTYTCKNRDLGKIKSWELSVDGVQFDVGVRGLGNEISVNGGDGEILLPTLSPIFSPLSFQWLI